MEFPIIPAWGEEIIPATVDKPTAHFRISIAGNDKPTEEEVVVESLGGLGDGIASLDGRPVFIAKSCVGDRLRVRIDSENQNGFQGTIFKSHNSRRGSRHAAMPVF